MYELIQVAGDSYYFQSPAKVGLFRLNETDVCLIDSGNDKDAAKKILRQIQANDWNLTAIYNTHSHADHVGGNKYLQSQTGCKIYVPGIECAMTRHPILEPAYLYGGFPPKDLRHKFLLAQESEAGYLTQDVMPEGLEYFPLPGHFFDMVGFRTRDNVVYLVDCLSSKETLDKYGISVIYDVKTFLDTLEMVKGMEADYFVPSHASVSTDIAELAQYNIDKVYEITHRILDICKDPLCFEEILCRLFGEYGLVMNVEQYVLVGSTVRSYLAWLKDTGRVDICFADNRLLWSAI